jgi:predicted dienelactone hydrolase
MTRFNLPFLLLLPVVAVGAPAPELREPEVPAIASVGVESFTGEWVDGARGGRIVPWRAYLPAKSDKPVPVVIVSHGLGGTRDGMGYLGEALAAHGVATVHLQHAGSDEAVWKGLRPAKILPAMKSAAGADNAKARTGDVAFALDRLAAESAKGASSPFAGRVDVTRAGVAGHSFGAHTSLTVAGVRPPLAGASTREPRIKAALMLSPPAPKMERRSMYDDVTIPTFIFTGTKDVSAIDVGLDPLDRQKHFAYLNKAPAWMVVFEGGDHAVYSGATPRRLSGPTENYPAWRACVTDLAVNFFRAELADDKAALGKLSKAAVTERVGGLGVVSVK